jgi:lysine 6-dehydrogenase
MPSLLVLGAGRVGRAIAIDLAASYAVTAVDRDPASLAGLSTLPTITTQVADLSDRALLGRLVAPFDLVVCAVPGFLGFVTLEAVIEAGKPVVDISFAPENALALNDLAVRRNVPALVDFGVAPGMDNFLLGYHDARMKVTSFECLVGGLPRTRTWPFEYKAPFSPVDVIEEYTRPARLVENGAIVTKPALSDIERVDIDPVGTLEAFNTDGLRSLLFTMPHIPDMKEKTLRYPGHAGLMQILQAAGFFSPDPVEVDGLAVSPLALTSRLLVDAWKLAPGEEELTVMRVRIEGEVDGRRVTHTYDLYDVYDPATGLSSMARTTGFACTAAVELVLSGRFTTPGVHPPETVGRSQECFDAVMGYLKERGVHYKYTVEPDS